MFSMSDPVLSASRPSAPRQGFTLIDLLVVIAIISIIAGFLVPILLKGREEANKAACNNNLRQIYTFAMGYSDKSGTRAFPIASGKSPRAHESLNVLIEFEDSEGLTPDLFICPSAKNMPAKADKSDKFVLDEDTLSYAWVAQRMKNTAMNKPLASDKYVDQYEDADGVHEGHAGMNVLRTDGSVKFVVKSELPQDAMLPPGLIK